MFSVGLLEPPGFGNPYYGPKHQYQIIIITMSQLAVIVFSQNYKNIIKRNKFDEAVAVLQYIGAIVVVALVYLFLVHSSAEVSRLQFGFTAVFFAVLDFFLRQLNKLRIFREISSTEKQKIIVLITSGSLVREAMEKLNKTDTYKNSLSPPSPCWTTGRWKTASSMTSPSAGWTMRCCGSWGTGGWMRPSSCSRSPWPSPQT